MPVWVIHHRTIDKGTAVKAFLCEPMKPNTKRRAGKIRKNTADAGEQLTVYHRIEFDGSQSADGLDAVHSKPGQRAIIQCQHVRFRNHTKKIEHFPVVGEQQNVYRRTWVLLL